MDAGITSEHIEVVKYLVGGGTAIGVALMWFESRMDKKLLAHTAMFTDKLLEHERREDERAALQHEAVMSEIRHVRDELRWRREEGDTQ